VAEPEPAKRSPIENLLSQAGISSDFAQKVRFRGPVGKPALIAVIAVGSLDGAAYPHGRFSLRAIASHVDLRN
jgi:hypothetical protein